MNLDWIDAKWHAVLLTVRSRQDHGKTTEFNVLNTIGQSIINEKVAKLTVDPRFWSPEHILEQQKSKSKVSKAEKLVDYILYVEARVEGRTTTAVWECLSNRENGVICRDREALENVFGPEEKKFPDVGVQKHGFIRPIAMTRLDTLGDRHEWKRLVLFTNCRSIPLYGEEHHVFTALGYTQSQSEEKVRTHLKSDSVVKAESKKTKKNVVTDSQPALI